MEEINQKKKFRRRRIAVGFIAVFLIVGSYLFYLNVIAKPRCEGQIAEDGTCVPMDYYDDCIKLPDNRTACKLMTLEIRAGEVSEQNLSVKSN